MTADMSRHDSDPQAVAFRPMPREAGSGLDPLSTLDAAFGRGGSEAARDAALASLVGRPDLVPWEWGDAVLQMGA